ADHAEDLARVQIEIAVVERGDAAVALDQARRRENGRGENGGRGHRASLRSHWSTATAMIIKVPIANTRHSAATPARARPLRTRPRISAPSSGPRMAPRPPNRLTPPITTAVIESRLAVCPACGLTEPMRPISTQAAAAQIRPAAT